MTAYGDSLELVVLEGPHVIFADVVSLEMRLVLVAQRPVPVCLGRDEDHENDEDDEGDRIGHDERNLEEAKIGDDEEDEENDDAEDDEPDAQQKGLSQLLAHGYGLTHLFAALFALLTLAGARAPAAQKPKIARKSIAGRCEAVLPRRNVFRQGKTRREYLPYFQGP